MSFHPGSTEQWSLQSYLNNHVDIITDVEASLGPRGVISDYTRQSLRYALNFPVSYVIAVLGLIDNVVAIVVLARLGFRDTMNISMTSLCVWDLLKSFSACVWMLHTPLRLISPSLGEAYFMCTGTIFAYLFFFTSYVSSVLAAYVAFERCLCVSKPFAVKFLLTPKVVTVVNVVISVVVFGFASINYVQYEIYWTYDPDLNKTIPARRQSKLFHPKLVTLYNVQSIFWPFLSFVVICVCTAIIPFQLHRASSFRVKVTSGSTGVTDTEKGGKSRHEQISSRDRRVIKMLLVILTVYILNQLPRLARYFTKLVVPEFRMGGQYNNLFYVFTFIMILLDIFNAAINPFIFYTMSSQFRKTFHELFPTVKKVREGKWTKQNNVNH